MLLSRVSVVNLTSFSLKKRFVYQQNRLKAYPIHVLSRIVAECSVQLQVFGPCDPWVQLFVSTRNLAGASHDCMIDFTWR